MSNKLVLAYMTSEISVSLSNISKCFRRYHHPVDRLKELLLPSKVRSQEFWALRNINLQILKGQTLGIVGRNGSGKSTLLQIIVGTLTPTTGQVFTNGKISALLELGSGFNPEFTGKQNIFFNGKILGLSQQEIEAKYSQIIEFADIGDFINQPVKTYSSGMFVRLAFAVAINVNPDILIVDEALSVGDEAFQRKCFSRIEAIQENGGTVLFVSHSAATVIEFCDSAILIDQGELLLSGSPKLVISKYQKLIYSPASSVQVCREEIRRLSREDFDLSKTNNSSVHTSLVTNYQVLQQSTEVFVSTQAEDKKAIENSVDDYPEEVYIEGMVPKSTTSYIPNGAKIDSVTIETLEGKIVNGLVGNKQYVYKYNVFFSEDAYNVRFGMLIKTITGAELGGAVSSHVEDAIEMILAGTTIQVKFKFFCLLQPGVYFLNAGVVGLVDGQEMFLDRCIDAAMFKVLSGSSPTSTGIVDFNIKPKVIFLD